MTQNELAKYIGNLMEWQQAGNRTVEIKFEPNSSRVWVYDRDLMEGQSLPLGEMPNIESKVEKTERKELARLKAKYEPLEAA